MAIYERNERRQQRNEEKPAAKANTLKAINKLTEKGVISAISMA